MPYNNAVGCSRAACCIITSVERKERSKGSEDQAGCSDAYCGKVRAGLQNMCDMMLGLLDSSLIWKVFELKVKADYRHCIAEVTERNLLPVAHNNVVCSRCAALCIITSMEQKGRSNGNEEQAGFPKAYCGQVEAGLQNIHDTILGLLDSSLTSKAFCVKVKADSYRCIAKLPEHNLFPVAYKNVVGSRRAAGVLATLRRRASRWAEEGEVEQLMARLCLALVRSDVPLYCSTVSGMAFRHLRLGLGGVRGGGVAGLLSRAGLVGDRGYRVMLHVDSTQMAFERMRHGCLGGAEKHCVARLRSRRGGTRPSRR